MTTPQKPGDKPEPPKPSQLPADKPGAPGWKPGGPGNAPPVVKPGQPTPPSPAHGQKPGEPVQKDPADAQQARQDIKDAQKNITDPPTDANVAPDDPINQKQEPGPGHAKTVKRAEDAEKESGPQKGKRVKDANPSDEGEDSPVWGKGKNAYVMTDVNGEKLMVTPLQWEKHGGLLMQQGWTKPVFAEKANIPDGTEPIPQNIDWGKDSTS